MDLGVAGKVAMVAGASRGLGFAVARALAAEGAHVSLASRDAAAIEQAVDRLGSAGATSVLGSVADVRSDEAIRAWSARTIDHFGGVDLLFVNAGGPPPGTTLALDDEAWTGAFELLVLSAIRMVRATVPSMRARGGGAIVVSTSTSVKEPIPNLALSNIVRASVAALAKTLANELAADHVRVNHLLPGRIETDRIRELDGIRAASSGTTPEAVRATLEKTIPLGRYGQPDEFASAALFLLSDAARYITGASLQVDGGMLRGV
ncbi:MAG: SDR family oxidoreductase [Vicinamibacterales bacterium]